MSPRPAAAIAPGDSSAWAGLLLLDKPAGVTSHDVVDRVRRRLRVRSAGHLGTLDPGASGLLVIAIGAATRCATVWQGGLKTYEGVARFGLATDTQDTEGRVLRTAEPRVDERELREAAAAMTGDQMQVPPMVSALKHEGRRLYEIARAGEIVEREARPVRVEHWEWRTFAPPDAAFTVRCSGGTYVRTLVHDLGERIGCGAALAALRRTRSEPFGIEAACAWRDLDAPDAGTLLARRGIPIHEALGALPAVTLDQAGAEALGRGQPVAVSPGAAPVGAGERSVVIRDREGLALALGELRPAPGGSGTLATPHVVFPWAVREGKPA